MLKLEIIGNLGGDAVVSNDNGRNFIKFRIAHTDKFTDKGGTTHENTTWVNCFMQGSGGNLLQYLQKGTKVYCRGDVQLRTFQDNKTHETVAGLSISVRELELCGTTPKQIVHDSDGVCYKVRADGMLMPMDGEQEEAHNISMDFNKLRQNREQLPVF